MEKRAFQKGVEERIAFVRIGGELFDCPQILCGLRGYEATRVICGKRKFIKRADEYFKIVEALPKRDCMDA